MGFLGLLHRLVRRSSEESSNVLGCFGEEGSLVRRNIGIITRLSVVSGGRVWACVLRV